MSIKQISVEQEDHSYLSEPIGVEAANVDIDGIHTLADKVTEWDNKVSKENGKGLSTNDFTTSEKNKLNNLTNYDDTELNSRVTNIEDLIPEEATKENKLATIADVEAKTGITSIPIASENTLGGIKVGQNLTIDADGTLHAQAGSGSGGGGEGGTSNYPDLANKPKIAGITLLGDKSLADLGIQPIEEGKGLSTNDYTNADKEKLAGLDNKVDKIEGKGLSSNDFTDAERNKLANLSNYDDSELVNSLNNKVDKVEGKGLSTNDFTNAEKTKLANLENYDDTSLSNRTINIEKVIPSNASSSNKLATINDLSDNTPTATTATAGKVKPDGTTIIINEEGTISAVGGNLSVITPSDIDRLWNTEITDGDEEDY